MLLAGLVALAVALAWTLVFIGLTYATMRILRRLGVEPLDLLEWLGLAERPIQPRSQRNRLGDALAGSSVARAAVPAPTGRLDPQTLPGA